MAIKTATVNGLTKEDTDYLTRIDQCLREIKVIHKDITRQRLQGRKVSANLRRQQRDIQTILDRVEATL